MRRVLSLLALVLCCLANPIERIEDSAAADVGSKLVGETALAVDLSLPFTLSGFQCIRQSFYNLAFIRAYSPAGQGQTDPYACSNIQSASAAGLGTEVYMTPQPNSTKTGAQQFDEMFYMFGNCNLIVSSIWIQVTSPANWSPTSKTNIAFLNSIFARAGQYGGITIGIYTNANEWSKITGSAKITNARLWYWNVQGGGVPNETPANFNDFRSFGGWSAPSVKQFAQSEAFCGVTVNRDVFDIATGEAVFVKETAQGKILVGRLGRGNDKSAKVAEIKE